MSGEKRGKKSFGGQKKPRPLAFIDVKKIEQTSHFIAIKCMYKFEWEEETKTEPLTQFAWKSNILRVNGAITFIGHNGKIYAGNCISCALKCVQ